MTNTPAANAAHFPTDAVWQRHNEMLARYRAAQLLPVGFADVDKVDAFEKLGRAA